MAENLRSMGVRGLFDIRTGIGRAMMDLREMKNERKAEMREAAENLRKRWGDWIAQDKARNEAELVDAAMQLLNERPRHEFSGFEEMWRNIQRNITGKPRDADMAEALRKAQEQIDIQNDMRNALKEMAKKPGVARAG